MPKAKDKNKTQILNDTTSITLLDKLYVSKIKPDFVSHIEVNNDICRTCFGKECTKFCPTNVFTWNEEDEKLIIAYENCHECGACKSGCPFENVSLKSPKSGFGVFCSL